MKRNQIKVDKNYFDRKMEKMCLEIDGEIIRNKYASNNHWTKMYKLLRISSPVNKDEHDWLNEIEYNDENNIFDTIKLGNDYVIINGPYTGYIVDSKIANLEEVHKWIIDYSVTNPNNEREYYVLNMVAKNRKEINEKFNKLETHGFIYTVTNSDLAPKQIDLDFNEFFGDDSPIKY